LIRSTKVQIYEKVSNETLRPLSCKTLVISCPLSVVAGMSGVMVRWLGSSFAFFVWLCAVGKMQMCYQMRWFSCLK